MKPIHRGRPAHKGTMVSRTVLSVVRILIASYFLAAATGLVLEPSTRTFLSAVLDQQHAAIATTVYLFATAFLIMVGKAVRPAALLLAVYIFWSGFLHFDLGGSQEALSAYWRDMALLGAVLLIAVTEPGGSGTFRLFKRPVAPRRIAPVLQDAHAARLQRVSRPQRSEEAPLALALLDAEDDDDTLDNIFADLWDSAFPEAPSGTQPNVFA